MSLGALQPSGDGGVACVGVIFWHIPMLSPQGG
jgi:hypothetical protein